MVTCLHPGFALILTMQFVHLGVDVVFNTATVIIRNPVALLVLYILQDIGVLVAFFLILLTLLDTNAFNAGLITPLMSKFAASLIVIGIYLVLNISYHTWTICLWFASPYTYIWNSGLLTLYVVQKVMAIVYYYFYKRAAMRLGNRKYYEDSEWLRILLNTT